MTAIPDPFDTNVIENLSVNDLICTINHVAGKSDVHIAFKDNVPEYVTPPAGLRTIANALVAARDAAIGKDQNRVAEQKALMAAAKKALTLNPCHISMLSMHRNDPSILGSVKGSTTNNESISRG